MKLSAPVTRDGWKWTSLLALPGCSQHRLRARGPPLIECPPSLALHPHALRPIEAFCHVRHRFSLPVGSLSSSLAGRVMGIGSAAGGEPTPAGKLDRTNTHPAVCWSVRHLSMGLFLTALGTLDVLRTYVTYFRCPRDHSSRHCRLCMRQDTNVLSDCGIRLDRADCGPSRGR
jgi:hypothetical protein